MKKRAAETKEDSRDIEIGMPLGCLSPDQSRALKRAGVLMAVADLVWVPQAALVAYVCGLLLATQYQVEHTKIYQETVSWLLALSVSLGVIALACLRQALHIVGTNIARRITSDLKAHIRDKLLKIAAEAPLSETLPTAGSFAAHITDQVDLLGPYYRNFFPQEVRLKIVPLVLFFVTLYHSWLAALILLICGPLIPIFMALIGMRAKAASRDQQDELIRLSSTLLDKLRGLETLELFGAFRRAQTDIADAGKQFRLGTMRVLRLAFLSSTVLELFSALGIAFCAVYVGFSLLGDISIGTWSAPLDYATGLFLLLLAPEFFSPIRAYAAAYHDRANGEAALETLADFIPSHLVEIGSKDTSSEASFEFSSKLEAPPSIQFKSVSLAFSDRRVLQDFSLDVAPGETVFLTGKSGAGKTSLLDCALGFCTPSSGDILINGAPAHFCQQEILRQVSWIDQAPRLFQGSIKSNLLKAVSETCAADTEELWTALRLAGAEDLVTKLPRGLSTRLGEDGFGLSVGEMRRIALARAAMRKDSTLLIADEPTASLDYETAKIVMDGLAELSVGRTTLIVTHDPDLFSMPGRIVDLNDFGVQRSLEVAQ